MKRPTARWTLAIALLLAGSAVAIYGLILETANPRTNQQDITAWLIFAIGGVILGAGSYLPVGDKVNWIGVMVAAFVAPVALFALFVMLVWLALIATSIRAAIAMTPLLDGVGICC
jgi:hypothetical protein